MNETLMARLGLDTSGFKSGLRSANSDFLSFAGKLGVGISAAGVIQMTRRLIGSVVEYADKIQDLSQRYVVNAEALQRLGNVAETEGSSLDAVGRAYDKLIKNSDAALQGNKGMIASFGDLGITVEDLHNLSPEELMLKIGKGSMKASDMVKVLGKSALELRPALAGLADETLKLGDAIDAVDIKKLAEAEDFLTKMYQQGTINFGKNMATTMSMLQPETWKESMAEQGNSLVKTFKAIKEAAQGNLPKAMDLMKDAAILSKDSMMTFWYGETNAPPQKSKAKAGVADASRIWDREAPAVQQEDKLSLAELQKEGAHGARWLTGGTVGGGTFSGTYQQSTGTMQAQYAAQQARLVEELEAKAKQARLLGFSRIDSQTPEELMSRADAIRQTLPIKETEKEVGVYAKALDATDMAKNIEQIRENTEDATANL